MHIRRAIAVALLFVPCVATAQKKDAVDSVEAQAQRARRGAGIMIGSWSLLDDPASGNITSSESLVGEGYFRKGLDKHLALEATAGLWRRVITKPATGGLGGSPGGTTTAILIPQLTSLKLYPFTTPANTFEPFISAGGGITIGLETESGSGGLLGGSGGSGLSAMIPGLGVGAAVGFEWRFSAAFGLSASGNYSYNQFFEDLAGERLYRGTGLRVGMTYRFQY